MNGSGELGVRSSFSRFAWDSALRLSTYGAQEKRQAERGVLCSKEQPTDNPPND